MQFSKTVILTILLTLAACAAEEDTDKKKSDGDGMIKQAVDAQQVPKKKAEALEQQLQEDFEKQQKDIDEQSGDEG